VFPKIVVPQTKGLPTKLDHVWWFLGTTILGNTHTEWWSSKVVRPGLTPLWESPSWCRSPPWSSEWITLRWRWFRSPNRP
jgi:hypothetical protein